MPSEVAPRWLYKAALALGAVVLAVCLVGLLADTFPVRPAIASGGLAGGAFLIVFSLLALRTENRR